MSMPHPSMEGRMEGRGTDILPDTLELARWDSPRTQICILGCWIVTGRRASHTEAPACPQTTGYSHQSQSSVRWGPRDLARTQEWMGEGDRPSDQHTSYLPSLHFPLSAVHVGSTNVLVTSGWLTTALGWIIMGSCLEGLAVTCKGQHSCAEGSVMTCHMRHKEVQLEMVRAS